MGKRKLFLGALTGAIVGGLITLFDRETRNYTKGKLSIMKSSTSYIIKNPSEAVHQFQTTFDQFNDKFTSGAESTLNALDQVQTTLAKMGNKNAGKEIE